MIALGRALWVAVVVAAASAGAAGAQDAVDVAKAKAEGKVVWYTSTPIEQGQKIADAFQKETGIKVEMFRSGGSSILRRFQQEMDAGRVAVDVLTHSEPAAANALGKKGFFVAFKPVNFDKVPEAAKDPNGLFVGQRLNMMTHYLRSDKVAAADEPKTWDDLLDPKWKGKVSIPDPKIGGGHYYFVYTIYKLFGKEWFEKARANDVLLTQSHGVTENQVMSGERLFGVSISVLTRNDGPFPGGKNAPINEALPKEGGALLAGGLGITKGGPNPAGAKVFVDWASSLEGQKVINHNGLFSLRKDFTSRENDDLSKMHYLWFDPNEMDVKREQYTREAEKILTAN